MSIADHDRAMELVDQANTMLREASDLELQAARASTHRLTKAVLYRSAASISYTAHRPGTATDIITEAMTHDPPPAIADELNELKKVCEEIIAEKA